MFEINSLSQLSKEIRYLIASFIVVLSIGFFSSISFVNHSNSIQPNGLVEQYNGNESDIDADVMKFKKSKRELLTIIHSHILSMSVIFFIVGLLLCLTPTNIFLKYFLTIEPFVSILLTFGGIYFLWIEILWFKYLVIFSGFLMTISFLLSVIIIIKDLKLFKG
ncbi:MAG: hypothetical protein HOG23_03765 [Flavobacteriaceae bacterium]|jgi:uncharacterized membrane protein SpoIIM required for sporulation|nr:hypothetical protein [Flavobacteriaceae bacterium]MBT3754123.1 hypothetical protein [Flavobacteriaceae bacterium]MBT3794230.1 hypothetical protein [Flavobacteriaceae bacterium]MBT4062454.1 hypothetical protein [Flavobacteriaceae bacterium]MBT4246745.1 hypothetical protein [Flavobacteriaceae bacterium]|tara:strand:+ start:1858 stop:2349 length:492 start_codon:yes stop_codon:yes gene_type:complete